MSKWEFIRSKCFREQLRFTVGKLYVIVVFGLLVVGVCFPNRPPKVNMDVLALQIQGFVIGVLRHLWEVICGFFYGCS